jgi:hypothetical protein
MRRLLLHLIGMDQREALWTLQRSNGQRQRATRALLIYLRRRLGHKFGNALLCIIS